MEPNSVLLSGDCLEVLRELPDSSIDSLVTDPPAGIAFMGKAWDEDKGGSKQWIAWMTEIMKECLRVLKPGAHGLVWAIPRTSHWTAMALEYAGFEVRDVVTHIFGSGFPKSLDISKALLKSDHLGASEALKGWGTALKPASEHWILVRKPISEKTIAANVLKHGTGGLNIDASRIGTENMSRQWDRTWNDNQGEMGKRYSQNSREPGKQVPDGRFPANLVFSHNPDCVEVGVKKVKAIRGGNSKAQQKDIYGKFNAPLDGKDPGYGDADGTETVAAWECTPGCAVAELDRQSGVSKSTAQARNNKPSENLAMSGPNLGHVSFGHNDSGGASRFFYCAKASKKDKGSNNTHPTVKSSSLMSYLIKLITPIDGVVLDPFMGSGSTGVAALKEGFGFIGIEKEEEYFKIAENRIKSAA